MNSATDSAAPTSPSSTAPGGDVPAEWTAPTLARLAISAASATQMMALTVKRLADSSGVSTGSWMMKA